MEVLLYDALINNLIFQLKERLSLLKTAEREKEESKRDDILAAKEVNHIIVPSFVVEQIVGEGVVM